MATQAVTELVIDAGPAEQGASRYETAMAKVEAAEKRRIDRQARIDAAMERGIVVVTTTTTAIDRQARAWENVVGKIDPVARATMAAEREMARAADVATAAIEQGITTQADAERTLGALREQQVARIDQIREAHQRAALAVDAQTEANRRLAAAERDAATAMDAQAHFNGLLGVRDASTGTAAISASVFSAELDRIDQIARQRAQQIGANFAADLNASFAVSGKSAAASASVFEEVAREVEEVERQATRLRATIDPLGAAQARLNGELSEYATLAARGAVSAQELAKAEDLARARFEQTTNAINGQNQALARNGHSSFQTANIAAQFQDVAVTAAMGMDPKMIALQQGTQLSGALAGVTSLRGAVSALGVAFGSLLSPISLATIAVVGLGAAGIQAFMGWLNSSHETIRTLEEYRKQIDGIVDGWDSAKKAADAAFEAANRQPKGVVVSDLQQTIRDQQKAANDLDSQIQDVNATMERNIGLFQHQKDVFANDPGVQSYLGPIIDQLQNLHDMGISASSTSDQLDAAAASVRELMRTADNPAMREFAGQLDGLIQALRDVQAAADAANGSVQAMTATTMSMGDFNASFASLTGQADAIAQLKAITPDLRTKDQQAEDIYKANSGSDVNGDLKRQLDYTKSQLAAEKAMQDALKNSRLGERDDQKADNAYDRITRSAEQQIAQSRAQAQALGMTDEAASAFLNTQNLLNQAANSNIELTPKQTAELRAYGATMAQVDAQTARLTDIYNTGRDATRGFASDTLGFLRQAAPGWKNFGDAAKSALDAATQAASNLLAKLADKALSGLADSLWNIGYNAFSGGAGTWNVPSTYQPQGFYPGLTASANGNVFASAPGLSVYANSIVNRPTLFPFANGIGLMGETGDPGEAIMPLRRTSSGRLGVEVANQNQSNDNYRSLRVEIYNEGGGKVETKSASMSREGNVDVARVIVSTVSSAMAEGRFDGVMSGTFGVKRKAKF